MNRMGDLIRREEAKAAIRKAFPSLADRVEINSVLNELPSVNIEEKIDTYKLGWHDAIMAALKETHNVYTEDGPFRVVQEETLIGLGMSVSQVSDSEDEYCKRYGARIEDIDECHLLCQWNSRLRCTKNSNERNCHKRVDKKDGETD